MTREERELSITYLEVIKEKYIEGEGYERHPLPEYYAIESAIKALEQEPRKGHWILGGYDDYYYICDKCKFKASEYYAKPTYNFCPNCGADMREVKE